MCIIILAFKPHQLLFICMSTSLYSHIIISTPSFSSTYPPMSIFAFDNIWYHTLLWLESSGIDSRVVLVTRMEENVSRVRRRHDKKSLLHFSLDQHFPVLIRWYCLSIDLWSKPNERPAMNVGATFTPGVRQVNRFDEGGSEQRQRLTWVMSLLLMLVNLGSHCICATIQ